MYWNKIHVKGIRYHTYIQTEMIIGHVIKRDGRRTQIQWSGHREPVRGSQEDLQRDKGFQLENCRKRVGRQPLTSMEHKTKDVKQMSSIGQNTSANDDGTWQ